MNPEARLKYRRLIYKQFGFISYLETKVYNQRGIRCSDLHLTDMTYTLSLAATLFVAFIVSASSSEPAVDPNVVNAANFAIEARNRMTNCIYLYKVVDILSNSAEMIPPSYVKYTLQVRAAQTTCRNNGSMNPKDCSVADNAQVMICDFVVLAVPGDNTFPQSVLSQNCD